MCHLNFVFTQSDIYDVIHYGIRTLHIQTILFIYNLHLTSFKMAYPRWKYKWDYKLENLSLMILRNFPLLFYQLSYLTQLADSLNPPKKFSCFFVRKYFLQYFYCTLTYPLITCTKICKTKSIKQLLVKSNYYF